MPMLGTSERRTLRAAEGRFLPPPEVIGTGERAQFRTAVSGVQAQTGAEIASTITVPVMKGRRGGDFERRVSGAERTFIGWLSSLW